MKLNKSTQFST